MAHKSQWHDLRLPTTALTSPLTPLTVHEITALYNKAASLHENEVHAAQKRSGGEGRGGAKSESSFLSKVVASGTLSDRLSALTLLVQSDPVRNVAALETLKGMGERGKGRGGRDESLKALRCVADWWVGGGAPSRKLKFFRDQPLNHLAVTDEHLVVWYFEDWLKKYFFSILQVLEGLSLDPLPYVRTQSLALISTLLREKPEQDPHLLKLLVNKLGDPEKSICSRASYHILQVLQAHPSMKAVVVREISSLILRPTLVAPAPTTNKKIRFGDDGKPSGSGPSSKSAEKKPTGNAHARYYGTITLNQVVLSSTDKVVASSLLDVYFDMFRDILGEGSEGASEAVPDDSKPKQKKGKRGGEDDDEDEVKVDKHGRIFDKKRGPGGKDKDKEKIGAAGFTELEDVNARLVSAILTGINRALPFAKLEGADSRIDKHIDTLFLITHTSTFNTSLQALVLIQQISAALDNALATSSSSSSSTSKTFNVTAKSTKDRYYRSLYASLHDPRLADSSKQAMYLNLFFKSVKADVTMGDGTGKKEVSDNKTNERIVALIRRFVQILASSGSGSTEFVAGGLYLLGELFSTIPGLRSIINSPPKVLEEGEEAYDPKKRDPLYAHATSSPLWELTPLLNHYHPTVALHARQLLTSQPLTASADLSQNTLSHFLDRFVYKNAKKVKVNEDGEEVVKGRGASAMQPAASALGGVKLVKGEREDEVMMNDPKFLRKGVQEVPVDQRFFYEYFSNKVARDKAKTAKVAKRKGEEESDESEAGEEVDEDDEGEEEEGQKTKGGEDEEDSEASEGELDEDEVWKAMQATMPKADDEEVPFDGDDEDSEPDLEGMDDDSDDVEVDLEGDESEEEEIVDEDDEDALSLVEDSDNEDLLPLDAEVPEGLTMLSDGEDEEWGGVDGGEAGKGGKRKRESEDARSRKKKLRSLPTFATYEDYAKLIEDGPEDDI